LEELLHEAVAQYSARAAAKGIDLWLIVYDEHPSCFIGDRQRIRQIVSNLLTNAIKFTDSGYVLVEATSVDGAVQIDVHDSGPGIPENMRSAIFKPFVQTHWQDGGQGSGRGLAISRGLAKGMNGRLDLVESSSAGSACRVTLPLPRSERPPETVLDPGDSPQARGQVLVV